MKEYIKKILFIGFIALYSLNIQAFKPAEIVPVESLPNMQSTDNIDTLIEKLKKYISAGEGLANKFGKLEQSYAKTIKLYTSYKAKCINMVVYQSPLFRRVQKAAVICHPETKNIFKQHLNKMEEKLESNKEDLLIIKGKLKNASQSIINLADSQRLNSMINELENQSRTVDGYAEKLKLIEGED